MPWFAGIERTEINWHPAIDHDRCVKCGMCMNCGKQVYDWTEDGPKVTRPMNCIVGCSTCANLCQGKCISFPSLEDLRQVYKQHGVWAKVKQELKAEGKVK
jgi:NAD-dependent dihydropyrimidine dehydrogenase PreA subunit